MTSFLGVSPSYPGCRALHQPVSAWLPETAGIAALTLRPERPVQPRARQRVAAEVAQVTAQPDLVARSATEPRARLHDDPRRTRRRAHAAAGVRERQRRGHRLPGRRHEA